MKFIEIYRVKNWYYYLGFVLMGFLSVSSFNLELLMLLFLGSFLLAYSFSLNDFCDEGKKAYFIFPLILSILFLPLLNFSQIFLSVFFLFIVTIYSAKPVRLKAKPFFSSLCNGVGFSMLFLLGHSTKAFDFVAFLLFLLFFSFNMVAQFIHEVVDLKDDKKNKIITTAVFLGQKSMKKLCCFFLLLSFLVSLYLFCLNIVSPFFVFVTLLFAFFFMYRIFTSKIDKRLREEYKFFGLFLGLIYLILIVYR